jgi:hypothetical protein
MKSTAIANAIAKIAVVILLWPAGLLAAQNADSAAISKLLVQVKHHAALANDDAATLESYTRSNVSWKTHAKQLNLMKEHVNNLVTDAGQLKAMREDGSPGQQDAIDRITPLLPVITTHLTAMIEHLNANPNQIHMRSYRDYVDTNQRLISRTYKLIADQVNGKARARAD